MTARTPVIGAPEAPAAPAATLAALARTAPPVAGATHPWSQQPGEPSESHVAFMGWLLQGTTRGAPARGHGAAAAEWDWAGRALAYDREQSTPAAIVPAGGGSPEAQIMANLTRLVQLETKKLVDQAASTPGPLVALKDLTATVRVLQEMHEAGRAASAATDKPDLSKLTADELRSWLQLNRKLQGQHRQ